MRALHERGSRSHVIVLTSFLDDDRILPAIHAGAAGYLLKDVELAALARAVRDATGARAAIDPTVAARLLQQLSDPTAPAGTAAPPNVDALRAGGAVSDRRRALEQANRVRARDRRKDRTERRSPGTYERAEPGGS
jgi:DNA-binding NarL/FixJ family response regulator